MRFQIKYEGTHILSANVNLSFKYQIAIKGQKAELTNPQGSIGNTPTDIPLTHSSIMGRLMFLPTSQKPKQTFK